MAPYLQTVLGLLGMADVTIVRVAGTSVPDVQATALDKALVSAGSLLAAAPVFNK